MRNAERRQLKEGNARLKPRPAAAAVETRAAGALLPVDALFSDSACGRSILSSADGSRGNNRSRSNWTACGLLRRKLHKTKRIPPTLVLNSSVGCGRARIGGCYNKIGRRLLQRGGNAMAPSRGRETPFRRDRGRHPPLPTR